jgi:hypothetical protein
LVHPVASEHRRAERGQRVAVPLLGLAMNLVELDRAGCVASVAKAPPVSISGNCLLSPTSIGQWADAYRDHGRAVVRENALDLRTALVDDYELGFDVGGVLAQAIDDAGADRFLPRPRPGRTRKQGHCLDRCREAVARSWCCRSSLERLCCARRSASSRAPGRWEAQAQANRVLLGVSAR